MDVYFPVSEIATRLCLPEVYLVSLIKSGTINSAMTNSGGYLVSEEDAFNKLIELPKEKWPQYDLSLKGHEISMGEAARKYGVIQPTISRWVSNGYITVISKKGQYVYMDEADISFASSLYKSNPGQGRRRFAMIMDRISKK